MEGGSWPAAAQGNNGTASPGPVARSDAVADERFGVEVAAAIVEWIRRQLSDYHANFLDVSRMKVQ